jgi:hypothetical protein
MLVRYHPHADEPAKIGWIPPVLDLHGRPLVNGSMGPHDAERVARVFEADKKFEVDEKAHPHLAQFLISDCRFSIVNRRNHSGTKAGA